LRNGNGLAQLLGKKLLSTNCQMVSFVVMGTLARALAAAVLTDALWGFHFDPSGGVHLA